MPASGIATANGTKITAKALREKLESQEYRCALTDEQLTPENTRLDHIIPVSKGGPNTMENVWLITEAANRAKHTLTLEEFVDLCRKVVDKFGG